MRNTKPFVQVACVCENILFDKDNVASLIRIVDAFKVNVPKDLPPGMPGGFPISIFIRLSFADEVREPTKVSIQSLRPDGTRGVKSDISVGTVAGYRNVQIRIESHVINPQAGNYWFEVSWNDELLTKIPITVTVVEGQLPPGLSATIVNPTPNEPA